MLLIKQLEEVTLCTYVQISVSHSFSTGDSTRRTFIVFLCTAAVEGFPCGFRISMRQSVSVTGHHKRDTLQRTYSEKLD
jgi:hypothetical protein